MLIEDYFGHWLQVLDRQEVTRMNNFLSTLYKAKSNVYPAIQNVYRAFRVCPYEDLRVVFLGQDPYPQKDIATGILFGNSADTPERNLSSSLQKVKDCLLREEFWPEKIIFDNTLESWAKQGILMLNSALTVLENTPDSYSINWRPFISKLLVNLSKKRTGIIYVLFGNEAQTFLPYINKSFNHVITCKHPAYYCRQKEPMPNIFKEVNNYIHQMNGDYLEFYKKISYGK